MPECNDCGTDVRHVWRHRAFENEGHRSIEWLCPGCHPELPGELTIELESSSASMAPETAGPSDPAAEAEIRPDGGVVAASGVAGPSLDTADSDPFACPVCGGETVDGQGMCDCTECRWTGPR